MTEELTEFEDIDPLELHLVQMSANAFDSPLVAKSAAQEKGKNKLSKKRNSGPVFKSGQDVLSWALGPLMEKAYRADQELIDNPSTLTREASRSAHLNLCVMKMTLAENARARYPERYRKRFPTGVQIVTNRHELADDPTILGWGWPKGSRAR